MLKGLPTTQKARLKALGIRHFDDLIHDQSKEWLAHFFKEGARNYPINVSMLIRNIIWQTRERVIAKQKPPLKELIRTFWYMYIKPTLARVEALTHETDQYNQLVDMLVQMVKDYAVMSYKDIGFRDDNRSNRKVGANANVILFSEKIGHFDFINEMAEKYQLSVLALGGQPSLMNIEYFIEDLKSKGVDLRRSFFLFSIVDYDASGWIIRNSFIDSLKHFGIKNITCHDLINPDMLTPDEIKASRYPLPDAKGMSKKNTQWLKEVNKKKYKNQQYLDTKRVVNKARILYGLEAEAVSTQRIRTKLEELLPPLLGKDDSVIKLMMLEKLNEALKSLIIHELT